GVPNKNNTICSLIVIRPKSIATVVVVFAPTFDRSSRPSLAVVIAASVDNGGISDNVPTNVVFPTPKPPATMILADRGGFACFGGALERDETGADITGSGSRRPWRSTCRDRSHQDPSRRPRPGSDRSGR